MYVCDEMYLFGRCSRWAPSWIRQLLSLQYLQLTRDWDWALGCEPTLQLEPRALGLRAYLLKCANRCWLPNYSESRYTPSFAKDFMHFGASLAWSLGIVEGWLGPAQFG